MPRLSVQPQACTACGVCELVCSYQHLGVFNPKRTRIRLTASHPLPSPPVFCIQCTERSCCEACPTDALQIGTQGEITFNSDDCTECGLCFQACEYGCVFSDTVSDKPLICDMCSGEPQCVKYCPVRAIKIVSDE